MIIIVLRGMMKMVNMIELPLDIPVYATAGQLPSSATPGVEAIVLTSPPSLYIYGDNTWNLIGGGGTGLVDSITATTPLLVSSPTGVVNIYLDPTGTLPSGIQDRITRLGAVVSGSLNSVSVGLSLQAGGAFTTLAAQTSLQLTFLTTGVAHVGPTGLFSSSLVVATDIADSVITLAKLASIAALTLIGNGTNASTAPSTLAGTTDQIMRVDSAGTTLGFGSINLASSSAVGATILAGVNGGMGVANPGKTITLGGNISTGGKLDLIGAFDTIFRVSAATDVTFPTSGTLATVGGSVASAQGTANKVLVNGTSGSAQTGALTLTLDPNITATSYTATTNSSSTTPTTAANLGVIIRNSDASTNNWMTFGFKTPNGNLGALIGAQVTDQTNNIVDLVLFGRNNSTGVTEAMRIVGSSNTVTLANALSETNGGTHQNSYTTGDFLYSSASNVLSKLGIGSAGQILRVSGGIPSWSTATYPTTTTANQLLYSNATNTITGLASGNSGVLVTDGTGIPSISSTIPNATQDNITRLGTIANVGAAIGAAFGGTGNASYAIGDLLQASASTTLSKLAAVATGNVLISGGVTTVSSWGKVGLTTHVSGVLPYANGGTNASTSWTQGSLIFAGASAFSQSNTKILWDDTNNRFGIGTFATSPDATLTINANSAGTSAPTTTGSVNTYVHLVGGASASPLVMIDAFGGGFTSIVSRSAQGTPGSPTQVQSGFTMLQIGATGRDSTSYAGVVGAGMNILSTENWTSSGRGTRLTLFTTITGTTTVTDRFSIDGSGNITLQDSNARQLIINNISSNSANTTGGGLTLPLLAAGYLQITVNGSQVKIPYYAN